MNRQKKQIVWLAGVFLFVLLLAGAYGLYENLNDLYQPENLIPTQSTEEESQESQYNSVEKAPDFRVLDRNGKTVQLSDFFGKPILLNFWASWCGPCKAEMPNFNKAYAEYGDEIAFVMVNRTGGRETIESATAYVDGEGFDFPIYFDTESMAAYLYGVSSIPVTYLIDRNGEIIARGAGRLSEEKLAEGIRVLLEE